ncbi:hypothetical protein A6A04_19420 [Paramagnetospirillum marisnigri]|uniref:Uncharacterized protein n=1 Tax=Paramagnetospirillum marisnigri TaxID=1285242 RepID=A0A178MNE3_9PROT|nr:hypothetical protein A6A04_19420 [Paramagnetospirillum marisnigri]
MGQTKNRQSQSLTKGSEADDYQMVLIGRALSGKPVHRMPCQQIAGCDLSQGEQAQLALATLAQCFHLGFQLATEAGVMNMGKNPQRWSLTVVNLPGSHHGGVEVTSVALIGGQNGRGMFEPQIRKATGSVLGQNGKPPVKRLNEAWIIWRTYTKRGIATCKSLAQQMQAHGRQADDDEVLPPAQDSGRPDAASKS